MQSFRISDPAYRRPRSRCQSQLRGKPIQDALRPLPSNFVRQSSQMCRNTAITVERSENAVNGRLQGRRVIAQFARFSESLVDPWIEPDDAAGELVELSL